MAAIRENLSTHCEMSVMGSLAGGGGRPGGWGVSRSEVTSDISRKSRSRIFLTTLCGRDAVGLKGPGVRTGIGAAAVVPSAPVSRVNGVSTLGPVAEADNKAAASSPLAAAELGANTGSEPSGGRPAGIRAGQPNACPNPSDVCC